MKKRNRVSVYQFEPRQFIRVYESVGDASKELGVGSGTIYQYLQTLSYNGNQNQFGLLAKNGIRYHFEPYNP